MRPLRSPIAVGLRSLAIVAAMTLTPPAMAERAQPGEVVDQVAKYTGLTNDTVSLMLKDNAAALGRLTDAVQAIQITQQFLDARDADIAATVIWTGADTAAEALLPPPLMTAIKAVRVYKSLLEELRDEVLKPALDRQLYMGYRAARDDNQDPINAFSYATSQSLGAGGYFASKPRMVDELIKANGWNVDLLSDRLRRLAESKVDRFWRERLEASYQHDKVKPQRQAISAAIWGSVRDILDQLKTPPQASSGAAVLIDPERDLPAGWWWARSAGAAYLPPAPVAHSVTPMWQQTVELSTAQGFVFRPYKGGGGAWCRSGPGGKCDLPYQRLSITVMDMAVHGGEPSCIQSLQFETGPHAGSYRRLSKRAISYTRGDPEQNGLQFCLKNFQVSLNDTAHNGASPDPAVTRHFADVIVRKINAAAGGGGGLD